MEPSPSSSHNEKGAIYRVMLKQYKFPLNLVQAICTKIVELIAFERQSIRVFKGF